MAINPIAINAYRTALDQSQAIEHKVTEKLHPQDKIKSSFMDTLKKSMSEVNSQQIKRDNLVESFATGENQNVHELMIQLQKANLAMSMTSSVRNQVMNAYKELIKMPF
jgi:flagellar hook-basal body complex protein FliE